MYHDIREYYAAIRIRHIDAYLTSKGWKRLVDKASPMIRFQGPLHAGGQPYELRIPASEAQRGFAGKVQRLVICLNEIEDRQPMEIARDIYAAALEEDVARAGEGEVHDRIDDSQRSPSHDESAQPAAVGQHPHLARIRLECNSLLPTTMRCVATDITLVLQNGDLIEVQYDVAAHCVPSVTVGDGTWTIDSHRDPSVRVFFSVLERGGEPTLTRIMSDALAQGRPDNLASDQTLPDALREAVSQAEFERDADWLAEGSRTVAAKRQAAILVTALAPLVEGATDHTRILWRAAARILGLAAVRLELRPAALTQFAQAVDRSSLPRPIPLMQWLREHAS